MVKNSFHGFLSAVMGLIYLLFLMIFCIFFIIISFFYLCNKGINSDFSCTILKTIIFYRHKGKVIIIFSEFWDKTIYNQSWHAVKWNNTNNAIQPPFCIIYCLPHAYYGLSDNIMSSVFFTI